jgi:hypothetical protein
MPDGLDILKTAHIEGAGGSKLQVLVCHRMQEAASQPRGQLRHGHDLQTVLAIACSGRAASGESQPALNDNRSPHNSRHAPIGDVYRAPALRQSSSDT